MWTMVVSALIMVVLYVVAFRNGDGSVCGPDGTGATAGVLLSEALVFLCVYLLDVVVKWFKVTLVVWCTGGSSINADLRT